MVRPEPRGTEMRVIQPAGQRGSLKWIQRAVNEALENPICAATRATGIDWLSPLASDDFAEYRDTAFLTRIGCGDLAAELAAFWPARGPQWDALGRTDRGDVLLIEAKAHVAELCSPATQASPAPRVRIEAALEGLAERLGARAGHAPWATTFYQLANRLAHLDFLRRNGVAAWLVLVNVVGDDDIGGPSTSAAWEAAYQVAFYALGLPRRHALSRYLIHASLAVRP